MHRAQESTMKDVGILQISIAVSIISNVIVLILLFLH